VFGALSFIVKSELQFRDRFWGKEGHILTMPKLGTNPRGVEFSKEAISSMMADKRTLRIGINWVKPDLPAKSVYQRWIDMWKET
jgi:hypothetical protein